jgi:hypothetical protein
MQRKSSFVHLLNLLIIGGLAFTGVYLLRNSSDGDGMFKPKSAGTTADSGSKIVESGLTSTDDNDVIKGKIVNVTMVKGEPDGQGTRGYITVGILNPDGAGSGATIAIMDETPIFKKVGEVLETASFDDLRNGRTVGVELDRPLFQASPIKPRAERVLILDLSE